MIWVPPRSSGVTGGGGGGGRVLTGKYLVTIIGKNEGSKKDKKLETVEENEEKSTGKEENEEKLRKEGGN